MGKIYVGSMTSMGFNQMKTPTNCARGAVGASLLAIGRPGTAGNREQARSYSHCVIKRSGALSPLSRSRERGEGVCRDNTSNIQ
jgi:hypothetical protein